MRERGGWELRATPYDHPDAARLVAQVQAFYRERYGGPDTTPIDAGEFDPPLGRFLVGHLDGVPVACGGWRARDGADDPALRPGDAEIKRMYVAAPLRRLGLARRVLAELERTAAAAGRLRVVLETGTLQPEAVAFYARLGYTPMARFGTHRDSPRSLCFAHVLD